jgi:hypothetical protein
MRRKMFFLGPALVLALLLAGGLWPAAGPGEGRDGGLRAALPPDVFQARTAQAISVPFLLTVDAQLRHNSRQAIYLGEVACIEGRQLRLRMTFTQPHGAEGWGQTIDRCTGDAQTFEIRVMARGPRAFQPGEVDFAGWAGEFERGRMTDEVTWSGTETLAFAD